jgi:predicted phage baseplate assembly protein
MPVPLPSLDDRRWADLVEEGRALIPFYGPEWTDHNYHCPGITFLELLAWITEMDVYQVNRVPERHLRKFLGLVGSRVLPPEAALAAIGMDLKADSYGPLPLPKGFEFQGIDGTGTTIGFRTLEALTVVSQELEVIQVESRSGIRDRTEQWKKKESIPMLGDDPQPGAAVYFGFNRALVHGVPITLYVQVDSHVWSVNERRRILSVSNEYAEECAVPPSLVSCEDQAPPYVTDQTQSAVRHHSAVTAWEILDATGLWRRVDSVGGRVVDQTRSFTLNGPVQIELLGNTTPAVIGGIKKRLHYVRCRFASGAYDAAPLVKDVVVNGVLVEQAVVGDPITQSGSGRPCQIVQCTQRPVIESSMRVVTTDNNTGQRKEWSRVADLDVSRANDPYYMVDATKGMVGFGDGKQGAVVSISETIAVSYLQTKAEAGNIRANSITEIAQSRHNQSYPDYALIRERLVDIRNRFPSEGGRAGETINQALARIYLDRERTPRAVTLEDYERLALETPGTRIARASAWANVHPAFPCFRAPGVITVVILPYLPRARPAPSRGLCEIVSRYLRRRRVVTTRVEVTGPTYTEVRVRIKVQSRPGVNKRDLAARLYAAADTFLHPLTGGPEKTGWPFGRDVYRFEVLQLFDETPGVNHVVELAFLDKQNQPLCGNVCLGRFGLVAAGKHTIEVL